MSTVFVKTTKSEREAAKLSNYLIRVLSLINGKFSSDELAKRAAEGRRNHRRAGQAPAQWTGLWRVITE